MLLVKDLGSDSPLYFSLREHRCTHDSKVIASPVVTLALWFRDQSRCQQKNNRPCVWVETGTYTNPSTEYCSAKCSPLASESPREWIQVPQSARHFQIPPNREVANRTAHRRAHLRSNTEVDSRELATSLLSPKSAACVVVEVCILSTSRPHSPITTVLCPAFQMRNATEGVHFLICHCLACLCLASRASQINSGQIK